LTNANRLMEVIREELVEILEAYSDERRSEIVVERRNLTLEDLISEEDVVVTLSHAGYVKSQPISMYSAQKRGGKGKAAAKVKEEDFIDKLFVANTHDTILCFSSRGKLYWKKVYELPQAGRTARGKPIINLLPLEDGERINAVLPIREYAEGLFIFMATSSGTVKKTALKDFSRPRANGIIAIELFGDDTLVGVDITDGSNDVMLLTDAGKVVRFNEDHVRAMGRTARGVRGIRLGSGQRVISLIKVDEGDVLTVTEKGYGKRTAMDDYPVHGRGGQGVISIQTSERNGAVVGAVRVTSDNEIMLISDCGTLVRTRVEEISCLGRNTQGVRLIRLSEGENLIGVESIVDQEEEQGEDDTETEA
ncbi:DNA gyrase C-terminal beta-propeller domain-containing protein, partial [Pseudomonadota bacterium]